MRITLLLVIVLIALTALAGHIALREKSDSVNLLLPEPSVSPSDHVAANGVTEGAQPEIAIRPEIVGTIAAIHFRENQDVTQGSLLIELHNETQKQQVAVAQAEVAIAKHELERLRNGERPEKRKALAALESAKHAIYLHSKADWERSQKLAANGSAVSREKWDLDYYKMLRSQAELEQASAERAVVEAPARADEVATAEARVLAAEMRRRVAQAELAKTRLTAPSGGRVLRVYAEPGQLAGPASAQPVLLFADLSKRRVRAFIEELDAWRVRVGQRAIVTVDGMADMEFPGTVAVVLPRMGKRTLQTDAPEEYKDLYFREALIDLDSGVELVLNLRVKTRISVKAAPDHERDLSR
jgi:HlyD family secretion protein